MGESSQFIVLRLGTIPNGVANITGMTDSARVQVRAFPDPIWALYNFDFALGARTKGCLSPCPWFFWRYQFDILWLYPNLRWLLCSNSGAFRPCIKLSHIQFLFLELNSTCIQASHWAFAHQLSLVGSLGSLEVDSDRSPLHWGRNETIALVGRLDFRHRKLVEPLDPGASCLIPVWFWAGWRRARGLAWLLLSGEIGHDLLVFLTVSQLVLKA